MATLRLSATTLVVHYSAQIIGDALPLSPTVAFDDVENGYIYWADVGVGITSVADVEAALVDMLEELHEQGGTTTNTQ